MKRQSLLICGAVATLAMLPLWTSGVSAGVHAAALSPGPGESRVECPLNRICVVTVDPRAQSKREIVGDANKISGFAAPDTTEGVLVRLDAEWVVLRDGSYENWIPRNKVLLIRVSR
jgi:hypothetical protein